MNNQAEFSENQKLDIAWNSAGGVFMAISFILLVFIVIFLVGKTIMAFEQRREVVCYESLVVATNEDNSLVVLESREGLSMHYEHGGLKLVEPNDTIYMADTYSRWMYPQTTSANVPVQPSACSVLVPLE